MEHPREFDNHKQGNQQYGQDQRKLDKTLRASAAP